MLDTMPVNPYSRKDVLVLFLTIIKTNTANIKPINADLELTRGKNIPKKKSAPKPLVSNPRKVLN